VHTRLLEASGVPVIELLGVSKDYHSDGGVVRALRDTTLTVTRGEFVALVGTSGSGKSTMMNILGCLDRPTRGVYRLAGFEVGERAADSRALIRNRLIGFIFQGFNLLSRTSALENVELPLLYRGVSRSERRARALAALEAVGLGKRVKHKPNELSGGQQQRVAIARALVTSPPMILADEPTGNLDTRTSYEVLAFLQRLNRERRITIVLVTHEPDIAACAGRIISMRDGRIVSDVQNEPTDADALLRALPPTAAASAFSSTMAIGDRPAARRVKIPASVYASMLVGATAGLACGVAYDKWVIASPAWWPLLLFSVVGECIAGEGAARKPLKRLGPALAARIAIPYTVVLSLVFAGLAIWKTAWWPKALTARLASLGPAEIAAASGIAVLCLATAALLRSLLLTALSPSR
jgi:putative ABC transport system ATP-binding protein